MNFEANYEDNLVQLYNEVNNRTYKIGKSICFIVTRPKKREVFAADFRDRIIHHVIMDRLEPLFEEYFIEDNYNCRKGKGVLYGVKRLHQQIKECSENYTKSCWIGKFDLQGFFMSIHKPTLFKMLESFIKERYDGEDIDTLLFLVKLVVLHHPERNCIRKSPEYMWNDLAKNKSLFTCGDDYGMSIGNLTSLCFANFYLSQFDKLMKDKFTYYGRYVDDFYVVSLNKYEITSYIQDMKQYLYSTLHARVHPNKMYIQHYSKGVFFIGAVVKKDRVYAGNRTVSNIYKTIHRFNKSLQRCDYSSFVQSLNSYFGFLKHYLTYHIKRRIYKLIDCLWYKYFLVVCTYSKFMIHEDYKIKNAIKHKLKLLYYDTRHKQPETFYCR